MPYLIDKLLGPIAALISAAVILLGGIAFLVAGHFHRDKDALPHHRGLMATIGMFTIIGAASGALIGGLSGAIWNISKKGGREAAPGKQEATKAENQTESSPVLAQSPTPNPTSSPAKINHGTPKKTIVAPSNPRSPTQQSNSGGIGANSPIISAPNGIAIGGGTVNNPTVNNYAPPERRLSSDQRRILISVLSGKKLNVEFGASFSVPDAPQYAQDLHDAFKSAGVEVKDEIPAMMMMGDTGHGVEIMYRGPEHTPGTMVYLEEGTQERMVSDALQMARIPSSVHSDMSQKAGVVTVIVVKP